MKGILLAERKIVFLALLYFHGINVCIPTSLFFYHKCSSLYQSCIVMSTFDIFVYYVYLFIFIFAYLVLFMKHLLSWKEKKTFIDGIEIILFSLTRY